MVTPESVWRLPEILTSRDPAGEESLGLFWNLSLNVNITGLSMLQAANSIRSGVKISLIHTEAIFPK